MKKNIILLLALLSTFSLRAQIFNARSEGTQKPVLHANQWMAITGKPLAATAGSMIFQKGGNAVDAACAMVAATCTMWDVLSWGGETQALIYNPKTGKVIGINALGVAPTGATTEFFKAKGMNFPPEYGPLAAVTPGTPGGICLMLAEYGTMSLKDVLAPAMKLAEGYPIEAQTANSIENSKERIKQWPYSKSVFLPHPGKQREAPEAGEIFRQADLLETLKKMVEAEQRALKKGKSRKEAIYAANDRFYKGDLAREFARGCQEQGGLITAEDLAKAANPTPDVAKPIQQALASISTSVQSGKYVRTWIGSERGDNGKTRMTLIWEPLPTLPGVTREAPGRVSVLAASEAGDLLFRGRTPDAAVASTGCAAT